jgi:DNA-binding GntR family transcriptional regulator
VTVPVPDLADPRAPYLQIADDLRRQIKAGRYHPGDRLPSLPAMSSQYSSASETIRRALAKLRDEGLVATQSTRGTFVLRTPGEAQPSPEITRLESALQEAEARITRHIDTEIARLREDLEYTRAQVMALDERTGGALSQGKGRRG